MPETTCHMLPPFTDDAPASPPHFLYCSVLPFFLVQGLGGAEGGMRVLPTAAGGDHFSLPHGLADPGWFTLTASLPTHTHTSVATTSEASVATTSVCGYNI